MDKELFRRSETEPKNKDSGVPQGFVLGPEVLSVIINELKGEEY